MRALRSIALRAVVPAMAAGVVLGVGPVPAYAATCTTATGITYYKDVSCTTLTETINGDTTIYSTGANSPRLDLTSSISMTGVQGVSHWEVNLYSSINLAGSKLALSNITTGVKTWNLTNYGLGSGTWNDNVRSLCQGLVTSGEYC